MALIIKSFVKGGSSGVAKVVAEEYPSLGLLQAAFLADKLDTLKRIANLRYSVNDNAPIRVGPAAAKEIYKLCDIDVLSDSGVCISDFPRFNKHDGQLPLQGKKKRKAPVKKNSDNNNNNNSRKRAKEDVVEEIEDFDDDDEEEDRELIMLLDKVEEKYRNN